MICLFERGPLSVCQPAPLKGAADWQARQTRGQSAIACGGGPQTGRFARINKLQRICLFSLRGGRRQEFQSAGVPPKKDRPRRQKMHPQHPREDRGIGSGQQPVFGGGELEANR